MKLKIAVAGALVAGFVLPAVAQAADEYYLVQDTKTKTCKIVNQKPATSGEWTMISPSGEVYKTQSDAELAMKSTKVCTETTGSSPAKAPRAFIGTAPVRARTGAVCLIRRRSGSRRA